MLYFATDSDGNLLDTSTTAQTATTSIICPFCSKKVILLFPVDGVSYFIHQVASECSASFVEQLYLYFQFNFPEPFTVDLPTYEHIVPSVSFPFPNDHHRRYKLPSKTINFEKRLIHVATEDVIQIQYDDPLIQVFAIEYNQHCIIFIVNLFGCEINRDLLPEELFFSSTVIELTLPYELTKQVFEVKVDIQSIVDLLTVTYIRNEMVSKEIQKIHLERQREVEQIAISQDASITRLVKAGIIDIRKH